MKNQSLCKIYGLILLFSIVLLMHSHCEAATYYIDYVSGSDSNNGTSTGTSWKHCPGDTAATGNPASQTLAAGDKIIFKGGVTYIVVSKINLSWGGSGDADANRIIYDGDSGMYVTRWGSGTGKAVLNGNGTADAIYQAIANNSYITLNNFDMGTIKITTGVQSIINATITSANYVKVTNNYIHEVGSYSGASGNSKCITTSSSNWIISGNTLADCGKIGIFMQNGGNDTEIANNAFNDKTSWAIAGTIGTNNLTVSNITVHHNTFYNISTFYAIEGVAHSNTLWFFIEQGGGTGTGGTFNNIDMHGNYMYMTDRGVDGNASGILQVQCNVPGCLFDGIKYYNNVMVNTNPTWNIVLYAKNGNIDNVSIYSNSLHNFMTGYGGLFLADHLGGTTGFFHNIDVRNNTTTTSYLSLMLPGDMTRCINCTVDYNNWDTSRASPFKVGGVFKTWAQWQAAGYDTHANGPASDPLYSNILTAPYNLSPQVGSPLIDRGANLGAPYNIDYSGTSRPQGPAWDIGAYEYNQSTVKKPSTISANFKDTLPIGSVWTKYTAGSNNTYVLQQYKYTGNTINKVTQDGFALFNQVSIANCDLTLGSYYYNSSDGSLYVHSIDNANPTTHKIEVYYF